ncbi:hypothetical protein H6G14_21340 [Nostoc parmelioides FACHB-3921]|uniref:DUF3945 domain-containing protein n=1 Tax=Nostoc parmelioides FACHB-3921 TaxID=2692909 RepID=A0ABR8BIT8_9NOSO|nr:hypothetical protein [Nostoc parmelioides FACHB-3921]
MFDKANQYAQKFRESIPSEQRLGAAAAAWSVGAARQDELERKNDGEEENKQSQTAIQKKIPNFVFAAFGEEIVSRLRQLQFDEMTLGTLGSEANNFKDKVWHPDEKYPIEIRASHHPRGHERHASRLVFVQDTNGEYKEYASLEPRTGQLPIGTQALANIIPGETYTANATIAVPGKPEVNFTIREIGKFAYAGQTFNAESVKLEIGTKSVPSQTVKIKLDGKTLGELDADSIKQLQPFNLVKDGQPFNLKLKTISDKENLGFVLAESPNGNLLRINNIGQYDYKGQTFNDENYRKLTLEVSQTQVKDAVFLNGQPLGVLFFKKDKAALKELGALQPGKLTQVQATLQSNFSTTVLKVDPQSIKYPEVWTKESQAFDTQTLNQEQQLLLEKTAPILTKIKERPTILFASPEDKMQGMTQMAVDNHKVEAVTKWLTQKNIALTQMPPEDFPLETKKGLAVFNLVNSTIPEEVSTAMTKKFGAVIESLQEYQDVVRSLPNRPESLQPSQPFPQVEQQTSPNPPASATQEAHSPSVTIEELRNWYNNAHNLGKPDEYKKRIVEIGNDFKAGAPLSEKAIAAMQKDNQDLHNISRLTEMAQRIGMVWGQPAQDGFTMVRGKVYDLAYNGDRKDLVIAQKDGEVVFRLESGRVQINQVTPQVLQAFEQANNQAQAVLAKSKVQETEIQQ